MFREFRWKIGTAWCSLKHESVLWPQHGHYECRTCGRRYPAFSEAPVATWTERAAFQNGRVDFIARDGAPSDHGEIPKARRRQFA